MNKNVLTIGMVVGSIAMFSSSVNAQSIVDNPLLVAQNAQECKDEKEAPGSGGKPTKICRNPQFKNIRIDWCGGIHGICNDTKSSAQAFCKLQGDEYTELLSHGVTPKPISQTISITDGKTCQGRCYPFVWIRCVNPNSVANNKPKKDRSDDRSPNWCTLAFDQIPIGDGRARKFVDLSSACHQHDLCFWTIGSVKTQCDNQFLENLKDICAQTIKSSLRGQCNLNANLYYKAVSDSGPVERLTGRPSKGFNAAQNEAKEVASRLQKKFPNLDISNHHNDIAWELANRQARGEKVAESINNATNAISNKISNKQ